MARDSSEYEINKIKDENMNKTLAIALLTGYVRGLWARVGEEPDPAIVAALRALGARPEHLQQIEDSPKENS